MEACVDQGLVRSIGVSSFNSRQIQEIIENCRIPPAVLQVNHIAQKTASDWEPTSFSHIIK